MIDVVRQVRRFAGLVLERFFFDDGKASDELTYEEKASLLDPGLSYRQKIRYDQNGNDLVASLIEKNLPIMVARLGATELSCLNFYLQHRVGKRKSYPDILAKNISTFSGFFPVNDKLLDKFFELYLDCIKDVDIMAVWFNENENFICNTYCPEARLVELGCLEPYFFKNPWSAGLKMKKVLVVHPFEESIKKQYEKRSLLFENPGVLPDFELKTIKAVQSIADIKVNYSTWFDALDDMCRQIERTDFDIAIIGAGAYGLPLASYVKRLGKQAIHLGGATQILFGIKGRRWETAYADLTAHLFNEHWSRPLESETPQNKDTVENGCYW